MCVCVCVCVIKLITPDFRWFINGYGAVLGFMLVGLHFAQEYRIHRAQSVQISSTGCQFGKMAN